MHTAEAKGIDPQITPEVTEVTEEIKVATKEIVSEAKEEAIEAPSRLRAKLRELEAMWERIAPSSSKPLSSKGAHQHHDRPGP